MNIEYMKYLTSIVHFLQTVTIKFNPFVKILNDKYRDILPVKDEKYISKPEHKNEQIDITTFPYYINLMGEYHKFNQPAYITDVNGNNVLLNRANMEQHPELKTYYSTNFEKLNELYYKYPESIEIIKCSLYPINCATYDELNDFANLSLLGYGQEILDDDEEQDIVAFIKMFLDYLNNRWYVKEFEEFEDMYPHAWWSTIWFLLFIGIMTKRILNIRTSFVNDYHIVEYLYSKGFEHCRYCFDDYIRKFLYKNYRYLEKLKGQNAILEILDKYIFNHFGFKIFKYRIQKHTYNRESYADWEPEVVLTDINDSPSSTILKFDDLLHELYTKQRITNYNTYDNEKIYNIIKHNKYNQILTKYLSLSQHNLNIYYDRFVFPLVFDFVTDMIPKISFMYDINDILPTEAYGTNIAQVFPVELLYIYTYCIYKVFDIDPQNYKLPTQNFGLTIADPNTINNKFYVANQEFDINLLTNIEEIKQIITPIPSIFTTKKDLTDYISKIFNIIIKSTILIRTTGDLVVNNAYVYMLSQLFPKKVITLPKPYSNIETFNDYFNIRSDLRDILSTFSQNDYFALANNILTYLVNIDRNFSPYISTPNILIDENCLYSIFDKLSSYNVNFLTESFYGLFTIDNILIRTGMVQSELDQGKIYIDDNPLNIKHQSTTNDSITNIDTSNQFTILQHYIQTYNTLEIGPLAISKSQNIVHGTVIINTGIDAKLIEY